MSKIGGRDYPGDLEPREAEDWMNILVNEFGGEVESKEAFAQAVGHKSTSSGSFRRKIADARKYGLMTPRGTFEATDLGMQLANPVDEQDRMETRFEMLQNISLFKDIYERINGNDPPNEFWRILTEITDADPKKARKVADWIEHLYESMLEAEKVAEGEVAPEEDETTITETARTAAGKTQSHQGPESESAIFLRIGNDELRFEELTDTNIEIAKQFLDSKKGDNGGVQMRFS